MRCAVLFAGLVLAGVAFSQNYPTIAPTGPRTPEEERQRFKLPPGFEAQLVAAEPDIHKPLNLAFDDRGRLWVTDTVEYPFAAKPGTRPRDTVKVLEDFDAKGRARKITTFADGLNIPIGVLPLPGGGREALVHTIPHILRLRDGEGTGKADQREVFLARFGFADTHGMTNSFTWNLDGWIHACHGFSNQSQIKARDGSALTLQSGNTYRIRPDGTRLEWYTHGQVNPFGLTLDSFGNLYSADCHSQPIYQLLRGGYYPSFGKPHDGLGYAPETTTEDHGGTGLAGIVYYEANQFPAAWKGTVFIGNVVTNRINHDRLTWHGSSPRAKRDADFLASDDPWFRPVDLKLGPDGALYVADFYNCIIGHYEVDLHHPRRDRERGRIWRIVYKGPGAIEARAPRPDWTTATINDLIADLRHPNLTVRMFATNELVRRGGKEVGDAVRTAVVHKSGGGWAQRRAHGLWVLERIGQMDAALLAEAVGDEAVLVRVHAQKILGNRDKWTAADHNLVLAGLKDADANVRRAAADALGRHPDPANLAPLLEARRAVPADDTHLLHVARMALRDHLLAPENWDKLTDLKEPDLRAIADVALGVPHAQSARFLLAHLARAPADNDLLGRFVHHIARHGAEGSTHELVAFIRGRRANDLGSQYFLLRQIERGTQERGGKLHPEVLRWADDLAGKLLASRNPGETLVGIELIGVMRLKDRQDLLVKRATSAATAEAQRNAALTALASMDAGKYAPILGKVLTDAEAPASLRDHAANLLARANQPETLAELVLALPVAPARLQNAIAANLVASRLGAEKLLAAIAAGKASPRLLHERQVAVRIDGNFADLKSRVAQLTRGLPPADHQAQELLQRRRDGYIKAKIDRGLGKKVFEKSCAACHQIANQGAKLGPQLDGIGLRGLDRLLEDILDPNRNVDQAFRASVLNLKNGQVVTGLVVKEEGEVLVLADAQGKEVRVPRANVEDRQVTPLSPMPANFAEQIAEADFYHLLAYLLSQRPPPGK